MVKKCMIKIKNLNASYHDKTVLENINLEFEDANIIGIIGPNGAGKSTLIKSILQLINYKGEVTVNNNSINKHLHELAYVEQRVAIDHTFPMTVKECVSLGTYGKIKLLRRIPKEVWEKSIEAIKAVGLEELADYQISELSGGQFQRMLLARCLIQEANIIFLDEPFVGIDLLSENIIMRILLKLKEAGTTIFIVHHDLSKVKDYFDQLIILNKHVVAYGQTKEVFTKENLVLAFGDSLFYDKGEEK